MNQTNGNSQLNEARESVNNKISRFSIVGNSKRVIWNSKRRFRGI